jgi:hypothetical protein
VPLSTDNADQITAPVTSETPLPVVEPPELPPDLRVGGFVREAERVPPVLESPERPVRGFHGREDAAPERIINDTTPRIVMDNSRAGVEEEMIGDYRVGGVAQMEGTVMHRRIWKLSRRIRAPADGSIRDATASIRTFVELLLSEARQAGATTLRITGELVANPNILRLDDASVRALNGTVRRVDAVTIEIVIPMRPWYQCTAAGTALFVFSLPQEQ